MRKPYVFAALLSVGMAFAVPLSGMAQDGHASGGEAHGGLATIFLWMAIILIAGRLASLVERVGQPSVLGELLVGIVLGNLGLLGIHFFEPIKNNDIIQFLAELGVVILLFQIGLETTLRQMGAVGLRAAMVAVAGVVVPFGLGTWVLGPYLLPGLGLEAYLFLGAALTATSVGITARVFRDLGKLQTREAQLVLGAAVIDDVLGLIVLAVVSAIATAGSVSPLEVSWIFIKAVMFLGGTIGLGIVCAPYVHQAFARINASVGMKFTLAIGTGLFFAYAADFIGLAPIVGAFAAAIVFEPKHFCPFSEATFVQTMRAKIHTLEPVQQPELLAAVNSYSRKHIEELVEPVGYFLVPLFFVVTGMSVNLASLFDTAILLVALGITGAAIISKYVAGLLAGDVNRNLVGWGMVPRGEVGLIFAATGQSLGVVSEEVFSVIVIMVILTTLITPPMLAHILKTQPSSEPGHTVQDELAEIKLRRGQAA